MRDTDGDGISDGIEIAAGTNPACAEGDTCDTQIEDLNTGIQRAEDIDVPTSEADVLVSQIEDLTPFEIRQLLVQTGADADTLSQIPDNQLKDAFSETLEELYRSGQLQDYLDSVPESEGQNTPPSDDTATTETDTTNQETTPEN